MREAGRSAVDVLVQPSHPVWQVLQNLTLCGICMSPFFITASNLSDLSELKAALPGIIVASVWNKIVKRKS